MNCYEILGLNYECSSAEIKSAYRKLARKYHPDINPQFIKKFKDIKNAYETLIDDEKRKNHDIINKIFKENIKKEQKINNDSKTYNNTKSNETKPKNIWNFLFNNRNTTTAQQGKDINADVYITLFEAINGTYKTINIISKELCPRCHGRKFINGNKCEICSGSGKYVQYKKIKVKIPPNIKNGAKLRIKNEGSEGKFNGSNGDLYIYVHIKDETKCDGLNVYYNLSISPSDAVLGGDIKVTNNITLKLPKNTYSGQKFRLCGQGLTKNGKKGDMIVTITIEIPKDLSDDEIKMYEKLKNYREK